MADIQKVNDRFWDWYGDRLNEKPLQQGTYDENLWPDLDFGDESKSHYIVRNDVRTLLAEVERLRDERHALIMTCLELSAPLAWAYSGTVSSAQHLITEYVRRLERGESMD